MHLAHIAGHDRSSPATLGRDTRSLANIFLCLLSCEDTTDDSKAADCQVPDDP